MQAESTSVSENLIPIPDAETPNDSKKKVVAAILLMVLVAAVVTQPDQEAAEELASTIQVSAPSPQATPPEEEQELPEPWVQLRPLSRLSLEDVTGSPMFLSDKRPRLAAEKGPLKVRAVYGSESSQSALVSGSIVRSGQPLPDGRTVLEVTPQGIELSQ